MAAFFQLEIKDSLENDNCVVYNNDTTVILDLERGLNHES